MKVSVLNQHRPTRLRAIDEYHFERVRWPAGE